MPKYELKWPCLHCPFRTDDTAIRFADRDRALEIWASAYFHGFPCHHAAVYVEEDPESGVRPGFYMDEDSQHCAGYIIMLLKQHRGWTWPGIGDDQQLADTLAAWVDMDAPVFGDFDDYLQANQTQR